MEIFIVFTALYKYSLKKGKTIFELDLPYNISFSPRQYKKVEIVNLELCEIS